LPLSNLTRAPLKCAVAAAAAFILSMAFYIPALPMQVWNGDTAEAQTVPFILGIAHPTGFPAYTLAGWLFTHVVAFGSVAWRMNLFAAFCTALTVSCVVLLAIALEADAFAALAAALVFALGKLVWSGAVVASPQTLAGLFIVASLTGSLWFARSGDRRALFAACICAGLGMATHPVALWVLPAIFVALLWQRSAWQPRVIILAVALAFAPLVLYGYFPLRSAMVEAQHLDPSAAAPLFGVSGLDWDMNAPRTWPGFLNEVLARNEGASGVVKATFDLRTLPGASTTWFAYATTQFSSWFLLLAVAGVAALALADRRALSVVVAGTLGGLLFAYRYRTDLSIDRYMLVSFAVAAALAAALTRLHVPRVRPAQLALITTIVLSLLAADSWLINRTSIAELRREGNQSLIDAVRRDVPDGAIVVAPWAIATSLGYGTAVEHALGSRTIVSAWPTQHFGAYERWSRLRRVVIYVDTETADLLALIPSGWTRQIRSTLPHYEVFEYVPASESG
jgi:4-amino-4-deoxy-L-arabinose transferase-like glycosyltransferase